MQMKTKKEVLEENLKEWLACKKDRKKRGEMIKNISSILHIHKKSVGRAFAAVQLTSKSDTEHRGRAVYYGPDVTTALYDIWKVMNHPCAENLISGISENIENLVKFNHWDNSDVATGKLRAMSLGTMKLRVGRLAKKYEVSRGKSSTRPSALKSIIPIFRGPWAGLIPGHGQIDTVAHCGNTLLGDYMFSVNYVDAATYWVEMQAQWNKGAEATRDSLNHIKDSLPVDLLEVHPDSGSEFINWTLLAWSKENNIKLTRSEPGKSNDNMYVEERNGHVLRKFLGYARFDKKEVIVAVNEYYKCLSMYLNYCIPVRRTVFKERIDSKTRRKMEDIGLTAYQRMLAHKDVPDAVKDKLREVYAKIYIFDLKQKLDILEKQIIKINSGVE